MALLALFLINILPTGIQATTRSSSSSAKVDSPERRQLTPSLHPRPPNHYWSNQYPFALGPLPSGAGCVFLDETTSRKTTLKAFSCSCSGLPMPSSTPQIDVIFPLIFLALFAIGCYTYSYAGLSSRPANSRPKEPSSFGVAM